MDSKMEKLDLVPNNITKYLDPRRKKKQVFQIIKAYLI